MMGLGFKTVYFFQLCLSHTLLLHENSYIVGGYFAGSNIYAKRMKRGTLETFLWDSPHSSEVCL